MPSQKTSARMMRQDGSCSFGWMGCGRLAGLGGCQMEEGGASEEFWGVRCEWLAGVGGHVVSSECGGGARAEQQAGLFTLSSGLSGVIGPIGTEVPVHGSEVSSWWGLDDGRATAAGVICSHYGGVVCSPHGVRSLSVRVETSF